MRNRFDQLGKRIGLAALGRSGVTVVDDEISPDAHHADLRHEPDPARDADRARLGLLGRIASILCLIEIYGHAPGAAELRACLAKHIAFWAQRARQARNRGRGAGPSVEPFLWIVAAGRPDAVLEALVGARKPGWPSGVYFCGGEVLRAGIVVASELPRERSTILVRLMAAGLVLPQAIADLAALPREAPERAVAEQILLDLQHALVNLSSRNAQEQEFVVTMYRGWEDARAEGQADALLIVLRCRGLAVPDAVRDRILAETDRARLARWLEKAATSSTLSEVLDDPSGGPGRSPRRRSSPRRSPGATSR